MNFRIIQKIVRLIKNRFTFAIAIIVDKSGSSPRDSGSFMVIRENGNFFGSVGGGKIEAKLIKVTQRIIKRESSFLLKIKLNSKNANSLGLICGGSNSILVYKVLYDKSFLNFFLDCLKKNEECVLILEYKKKKILHNILYKSGTLSTSLLLKKKIVRSPINYYKKFYLNETKIINYRGDPYIFLPITKSKKLFIFGAGHIAEQIVSTTFMLNFKVIIIDDRVYFANKRRLPRAFEIKIVNFNSENYLDKIDYNSSIIIITRGHLYDQKVLERSLLKKNKYIGMVGSINKRNSVYVKLKIKGFSSKALKKIHSPIGVKICSETPEEISLSILSEIILVNSKKKILER